MAICQHLNLIIPFIANISLTIVTKDTEWGFPLLYLLLKKKRTLCVREKKNLKRTVRCPLLTKRDAAIYIYYFQMLHRAIQTYQEHIYITCGWNFWWRGSFKMNYGLLALTSFSRSLSTRAWTRECNRMHELLRFRAKLRNYSWNRRLKCPQGKSLMLTLKDLDRRIDGSRSKASA